MGTLVCRIELDKMTGAKVTIENADGKITQTIHMDGTKITTKVAGEKDTSTIMQVADAITVTVKNFTLDAETILFKSSKTSTWTSQDTLDVKSSKAMTVKSDETQAFEATQDASYKGMNVALTPITNTWTLLSSGTFGGLPLTFTDTQATNHPQRFYLLTVP